MLYLSPRDYGTQYLFPTSAERPHLARAGGAAPLARAKGKKGRNAQVREFAQWLLAEAGGKAKQEAS
jgi:hypothetical protein